MFTKFAACSALGLMMICGGAQAQKRPAVLMECRENGGRTLKGAYFVRWSISQQGLVNFENNDGKRTLQLKPTDLQKLRTEIRIANYDALTAKPSGKMTPAAYDGTETNYVFHAKGRRHAIATYKYVFPPNTLLKTVETLRTRYQF
jgi:hypothetical protein